VEVTGPVVLRDPHVVATPLDSGTGAHVPGGPCPRASLHVSVTVANATGRAREVFLTLTVTSPSGEPAFPAVTDTVLLLPGQVNPSH
jgi:hypothetical protein